MNSTMDSLLFWTKYFARGSLTCTSISSYFPNLVSDNLVKDDCVLRAGNLSYPTFIFGAYLGSDRSKQENVGYHQKKISHV